MSKENEKRERTKESKEKESTSLAHTARTREELQRIARSIPTVEQVIGFAKYILGFNDEHFCREWHRQMEMAFWCDEFGNPIRNWGWVFNKWRLNKDLFERLRDPERIRRFGKVARPQDDPDTRKKRINRAWMAIIRHMPECLETFWLIIRNGKNRKESIWQLMKGKASKRPANGRPRRYAIGTT